MASNSLENKEVRSTTTFRRERHDGRDLAKQKAPTHPTNSITYWSELTTFKPLWHGCGLPGLIAGLQHLIFIILVFLSERV
jgi:hypothetical protein